MEKLMITGATGQLGQAVLTHLLKTYRVAPEAIVAGTRQPDGLAAFAAQGVETRLVDFDTPASLATAFTGIDRLLIISTSELAVPGKRLAQQTAAVAAAVTAGVKHLVYTSMPNPDRSLLTFAGDHLGTEMAIKTSGLRYTILRNAWYTDNYFLSLPHAVQTGTWFAASGAGRLSNISRDDCARAAAAALLSPPAGQAVLTLTGPEALAVTDIAAQASQTLGKPITVQPVSDAAYAAGLEAAGMPPFVAQMLASSEANIRAGNFDLVTEDFTALTGEQPQRVADFFAANRAAFLG